MRPEVLQMQMKEKGDDAGPAKKAAKVGSQ
jgi:hypothetical protein